MITADDSSALMEAEIAAIIQEETRQTEPTIEATVEAAVEEEVNEVVDEEVVEVNATPALEMIEAEVVLTQEEVVNEEAQSEQINMTQELEQINETLAIQETQHIQETQTEQTQDRQQISEPVTEEPLSQDITEESTQSTNTIVFIEQPVEVDSNDGPRAKHLKQALRKALNNTIKSCSGEKLETCFPFNLKATQMNSINSTIIQSLQTVIEGVQKPFEDLIASEGLVDKLNKLDEFTRLRAPDALATETAASLASLTPQNLIDRRLYATKLSALNQLEAHLKEIENENSNLASELNSRQSAFAERLDRLKSSQQLLDLALDQISQVPMEEMESLVDKMNHQYQPGVISLPKIKLNE